MKIYGFIFGFQRRVRCPKWAPDAKRSSKLIRMCYFGFILYTILIIPLTEMRTEITLANDISVIIVALSTLVLSTEKFISSRTGISFSLSAVRTFYVPPFSDR